MRHPGDHPAGAVLDAPAAEGGEAVEQAIQDQGAKEGLRRVVNGEEVLGADVLSAAQVVSDRHGVVVEGPIEQAPTTAYVQDERDIGAVEYGPELIEVRMRRRTFARRRRRDHHRRAPAD